MSSGSILLGNSEESTTGKISLEMSRHLYDMARLSVGGLEPNELSDFQSRNADLMGQLIQKTL